MITIKENGGYPERETVGSGAEWQKDRGKIAKGEICAKCGIYFSRAHGYPVVCKHCIQRLKRHEIPKYHPAVIPYLGE